MLPAGPRSTFPAPATYRQGARELVQQLLTTIQGRIAAANEVRPATVTTGCDGLPNINPLNGTACNGNGGPLVLFNPTTRTVLTGSIGRSFAGTGSRPAIISTTAHPPASCDTVIAALKARRRFVDQNGNVYGPTGTWIGHGDPPTVLETDYVHQMIMGRWVHYADPPTWKTSNYLYLKKTVGVPAILSLTPNSLQGGTWPSVNDLVSVPIIITDSWGQLDAFHVRHAPVLDDAVFGGSYSASDGRVFYVTIDGTGTPNTFKYKSELAVIGDPLAGASYYATGVSITGGPQSLGYGVTVTFGTTVGHTMNDTWFGGAYPGDNVVRAGVAVRGTLDTATPCINGGFPNSNVLLTTECNASNAFPGPYGSAGSHALVVRDPNTLAILYRKALLYDGTPLAWGDPPQKFCFSTNDEGLFFMHAYTVPVLASPPTPYPGAEFGSPNSRKIAVISVNPTTYEPTITELITLEDAAGYTSVETFAVAKTV
jgi:hypothetical protein